MDEFTVILRAAEYGETPTEERLAAVLNEAGGDHGMAVEVTGVWADGPAESDDNDQQHGSAKRKIVGSAVDPETGTLWLFVD